MARTDVIVLGAGIIGTSAALHLAKRGLAVALVDRGGVGEGTSYGNGGIIEGNTYFPYPFPTNPRALLRIALKQATEANYHLSHLPRMLPWLFAYWRAGRPQHMFEFAHGMRPLFAAAVAEHEALLKESGADKYLRRNGWLKIYRNAASYQKVQSDLDAIGRAGLEFQRLDQAGALALEPDLAPIFANGVFWPSAASISNPLAVTRAYAAQFSTLGGVVLKGDARTLHRSNERWRVDTDEGPVDAPQAVIALGPWSQQVLDRLGLTLPLQVKRGYHLHFKPRGNRVITRPTLDADVGYLIAPMEQGLRLTTGAEFAGVEAPPTPVQFDRLMPKARELFPLGEQVEQTPWMGSRPSFPDSRPVIGRAPGLSDLWLDFGHTHWGLTLGPVSGRLLAEMMTGTTPFCDPKPYQAERFLKKS